MSQLIVKWRYMSPDSKANAKNLIKMEEKNVYLGHLRSLE